MQSVIDHKYISQGCHLHGCQQLVLVDALERLLHQHSISNRLFARAAIAQTHIRDDGKCEICAKEQVTQAFGGRLDSPRG